MPNGPVSVPSPPLPPVCSFIHTEPTRAVCSDLMVPDEFKNLGFQDGAQVRAKEKGDETKSGNRLEELKRENAELLKKHAAEKKQ